MLQKISTDYSVKAVWYVVLNFCIIEVFLSTIQQFNLLFYTVLLSVLLID